MLCIDNIAFNVRNFNLGAEVPVSSMVARSIRHETPADPRSVG